MQWRQAAIGAHQQARQFVVAFLAGGGGPSGGAKQSGVATSVHSPGGASTQEHCQGSDGAQAGGSLVLDVAEWVCVFTFVRVWFVRGAARYRTWWEVRHRPLGWASRSLEKGSLN